jgi:rhamnosyltransferase
MEFNHRSKTVINKQIACVFVLFHPDTSVIDTLKLMLASGYCSVAVVNGINSDLLDKLLSLKSLRVIVNKENLGLAFALNQGIRRAIEDPSIKYITLFDQDSQPLSDMPLLLANELNIIGESNYACIGPRLVDKKKLDATYRINKLLMNPDVLTIPTSGTLMTKFSYGRVGPMLDTLFIDGIDHEWCFRARHHGLKVAVSATISMIHNMGDAGFGCFGTYKPIHRSPIRHFYITRNTISLMKLSYIPFYWKIKEMLKMLRRVIFYVVVSKNRKLTARLILKGFVDGLKNKLGPIE